MNRRVDKLSLLPSSARLSPKRKNYLKEKWRLGRHRADEDEGRGGKRQAKSMSERGGSEVGGECFFFFPLKVQMSGWHAARGVQPKNLFNVCFTGQQEG